MVLAVRLGTCLCHKYWYNSYLIANYCIKHRQVIHFSNSVKWFKKLLQYFRRYMSWKFGQFPKCRFWARFAMVTDFFGPSQLVLVQITHSRYRASDPMHITLSAFWCLWYRFRGEIAEIAVLSKIKLFYYFI